MTSFDTIKKCGLISYPKYIHNVAAIVGKLREIGNVELDRVVVRFKRGGKDSDVHILGLTGELIVQHYLHSLTIKYVAPPLMSINPISESDIRIGEVGVDVKTVRPNKKYLSVNAEAHRKKSDVTHYWFVEPLEDELAQYWIYKKSEVDGWEQRKLRYSKAFYKTIRRKEVGF